MNLGSYGFPQGGQATAAVASTSGRWLRTTVFTANGNWNNMFDASYIVVYLLGGGGGGGGSRGAADYAAAGAPGAGGGGCIKYILATSLGATEAVSIGAGGTAGTNTPTDGSIGGASSFGAFCSASGGEGGRAQNISAPTISGPTALGGIGTGGDVNFRGDSGFPVNGPYQNFPGQSNPGANGALPIGGAGARGNQGTLTTSAFSGISADANTGGGGSGGVSAYAAASPQAGGNGGSGLCVVYEFA